MDYAWPDYPQEDSYLLPKKVTANIHVDWTEDPTGSIYSELMWSLTGAGPSVIDFGEKLPGFGYLTGTCTELHKVVGGYEGTIRMSTKHPRKTQCFTVPLNVVARNSNMYKVDGKHKSIQVSPNQTVVGKIIQMDRFQSGFLSIEVELHPWDNLREVRDRMRAERIAKTEATRPGATHVAYITHDDCDDYMGDWDATSSMGEPPLKSIYEYLDAFKRGQEELSIYGIRRTGEMTFPINFTKESTMKVFEAIVLKLDPDFHPRDTTVREPVEIVKVVAPFLAASETAAREAVLIDYAKEANLAGKDLTGYSVVVRSFRA